VASSTRADSAACWLLALDALRLVGQVNGLLLGLAREGVTLAGQFRHLLGQGIALGLDHFTSGGQLGGFTLGLYQAPLDLGAGLGGGTLDLGRNGRSQRLGQFRRGGGRHGRASRQAVRCL
jgi:hypothetical protein